MDYTINEGKKAEVTITVTFPFSEIEKRMQAAASHISEHVDIKGFRKGKAPLEKVIDTVGVQKVLEEAAEKLVKKSYTEILIKEKIEPISQPKIEFQKLAEGNDFIYTAAFVKIPTIEIGDIKTVKVKDVQINITDEEVEKVIDDMREHSASEVLEDKKSEIGDKVEVDFDVFLDNVPIENGAGRKYPLILGKGQMIPGFEDQLLDMKKDEEKEFTLTFPKEYHNKQLAGNKALFKVKMLAVYKRTLPEANDSFAKIHGSSSLNELKSQITSNLKQEQAAKQNQRLELEIIESLIKKSKFSDIPDVLINQELDRMINEMKNNVTQQGLAFEEYLQHLKKDESQLRLDFAAQALDRVKAALLSRAIFLQNNMEVTNAEIEDELQKYREMYKGVPDIAKTLESNDYKEMLRNVIGNSKVMQFLKNTVQIEK